MVDTQNRYNRLDLYLLGFILIMGVLYVIISNRRSFDFDEFQVMYASASILRGKAYYADKIGTHFPFSNILISLLIYITGFKAVTILVVRYFILLVLALTLSYVYRIGELIWDRKTGLLAVAFALLTLPIVNKGIEIRHDVFNTLFNVMGCFYVLKYFKGKRTLHLLVSGICLGMAIASTQKAIIWSAGIILGTILYLLREGSYKNLRRVFLTYVALIPLPLIICISYLVLFKNESFPLFLKVSIIDLLNEFSSQGSATYPFRFSSYTVFKGLFFQNPFFYILGIGGICSAFWGGLRDGNKIIIVTIWGLVGLLFYISAKRPFHQSFLPTIPALALIAGGTIANSGVLKKGLNTNMKMVLITPCIFLLFAWPFYHISMKIYHKSRMMDQINNISFCLFNLKANDHVLSFTQNQIFFDSTLKLNNNECGDSLYVYDPRCFERKMISKQCKVIINDYRTRSLNQKVKEKIKNNYIHVGKGNILIPGFKIEPGKKLKKKIWVKGYYYSPTLSLKVNGVNIKRNVVQLNQEEYLFHNPSTGAVILVYLFNPERIINQSASPAMTTR